MGSSALRIPGSSPTPVPTTRSPAAASPTIAVPGGGSPTGQQGLSLSLLSPPPIVEGLNQTLWIRVAPAEGGAPLSNATVELDNASGVALPATGFSAVEAAYGFFFHAPLLAEETTEQVFARATAKGFLSASQAFELDLQQRTLGGNGGFLNASIASGSVDEVEIQVVNDSLEPVAGALIVNYSWCNLMICPYPVLPPLSQASPLLGTYYFAVMAPLVESSQTMVLVFNITCLGYSELGQDWGLNELVTASPLTLRALPSSEAQGPPDPSYVVGVEVGSGGAPVQGAAVAVTAAAGTFATNVSSTNSQGEAFFLWTPPPTAGRTYALEFSAVDPGHANATLFLNETVASSAPTSTSSGAQGLTAGLVASGVTLAVIATALLVAYVWTRSRRRGDGKGTASPQDREATSSIAVLDEIDELGEGDPHPRDRDRDRDQGGG